MPQKFLSINGIYHLTVSWWGAYNYLKSNIKGIDIIRLWQMNETANKVKRGDFV